MFTHKGIFLGQEEAIQACGLSEWEEEYPEFTVEQICGGQITELADSFGELSVAVSFTTMMVMEERFIRPGCDCCAQDERRREKLEDWLQSYGLELEE